MRILLKAVPALAAIVDLVKSLLLIRFMELPSLETKMKKPLIHQTAFGYIVSSLDKNIQ
jgi:hypothetical protein